VVGSLQPFPPLAPALARLPALSQLSLAWAIMLPSDMHSSWSTLQSLSALCDLCISDWQRRHEEHTLPQSLPALAGLTHISLAGVRMMSGECARALAACTGLRKLSLCAGSRVRAAAVSVLAAHASEMAALTYLVIEQATHESVDGVVQWQPGSLATLTAALTMLRSVHRQRRAFGLCDEGLPGVDRADVMQNREVLLALARTPRLRI
jgi:hypothetical protein